MYINSVYFYQDTIVNEIESFFTLANVISCIKLPINWNSIHDDNGISFFLAKNVNGENIKIVVIKQLTFTVDGSIVCSIMNNVIELEQTGMKKICYPLTVNCLQDLIKQLNDKKICTGGPSPLSFPGNNNKVIIIYIQVYITLYL